MLVGVPLELPDLEVTRENALNALCPKEGVPHPLGQEPSFRWCPGGGVRWRRSQNGYRATGLNPVLLGDWQLPEAGPEGVGF